MHSNPPESPRDGSDFTRIPVAVTTPSPASPTPRKTPRTDDHSERLREIAIALSESDTGLPRVVASGKGAVARQILEIAFSQGVKVREDADLAEILAAVDVDNEIPLAALAAVAEILSYVYRASGAGAGPTPNPPTGMPAHG